MGDKLGLNIHQVCQLSAINISLQKSNQNFSISHYATLPSASLHFSLILQILQFTVQKAESVYIWSHRQKAEQSKDGKRKLSTWIQPVPAWSGRWNNQK